MAAVIVVLVNSNWARGGTMTAVPRCPASRRSSRCAPLPPIGRQAKGT